jgi:hypothetical protein
VLVLLPKYYLFDQIKKNEMGGACGAYGRQERCRVFWWGNLKERNPLEDLGVDGRVVLKWISKKWGGQAWSGFMGRKTGTGGGLL